MRHALAALLTGAILTATPVAAAADPQAPADIVVKSKKICRDLGSTGSRARSNRLCLTREQWAERRDGTRQLVDDWDSAIRSDRAAHPLVNQGIDTPQPVTRTGIHSRH